jgi:hypothetical protein
MMARDGAHFALGVNARVKSTPSRATRSNAGVLWLLFIRLPRSGREQFPFAFNHPPRQRVRRRIAQLNQIVSEAGAIQRLARIDRFVIEQV